MKDGLDMSDRAILSVLEEDSRKSIRDIARTCSLRPSTVHQRIQKMKETGVIERFTVKLNNEKLGRGFIAFILLSTKKDIDRSFLSDDHVREVFGVTGEHDILVKLKFKDVHEFNDFIIMQRKKGDISKSVSLIATINLKEEL